MYFKYFIPWYRISFYVDYILFWTYYHCMFCMFHLHCYIKSYMGLIKDGMVFCIMNYMDITVA